MKIEKFARLRPLASGFGAEVLDFNMFAKNRKNSEYQEIGIVFADWLKEFQFLIFRKMQRLTDREQILFSKIFGRPVDLDDDGKHFTQQVIGNPFSYWHCDVVSSIHPPPQFTVLHCLVAPRHTDCDTLFINNQNLLEALPQKTLRFIQNQKISLSVKD